MEDPDQTQAMTPEMKALFAKNPPIISDYELVRVLGEGGFGQVWLAKSKTGVYRAVKILQRSALSEVEFNGIRTYERQARGHPNLIDVRHVGESAGCWYYVMELADGVDTAQTFSDDDYEPKTLQALLRRSNYISLEDAIEICRGILVGLSHLHHHELLHRDVKPGNIVFVDGIAKLADIGLLTHERRREVEGHTPLYAPPGGVQDRTGDLYCVGRILHELISGTPAARFPELPAGADETRLAAIKRISPIVDRACAPDKYSRFQTAEEFLDSLNCLTSGPGAKWHSRRRLVATLVVIVLAVVAWLAWPEDPVSRAPDYGAQSRKAISGSLSVLVKESKTAKVHFEASDRFPVQPGDLIRVKAEFDQECYPAVVLMTGERGIDLVYPIDISSQRELNLLEIPSETSRWWPITPTAGRESETITFLMFARHKPFDQDSIKDLTEKLLRLGQPPRLGLKEMVVLSSGRLKRIGCTSSRTRGVDLDAPVETELGLLEQVHAQLSGAYDVVEAVAIPQRAGKSE